MVRKYIFITLLLALLFNGGCKEDLLQEESPPEVANISLSELNELCDILDEVITNKVQTANKEEQLLLNQTKVILDTITHDMETKDLISEKTEEERLLLDILSSIAATGLSYWARIFHGIDIPSQIWEKVAEGAENLGNEIAEMLWGGDVGFAKITETNTGFLEIIWNKYAAEIWASIYINSQTGQIHMHIPIELGVPLQEENRNPLLSNIANRPIIDEVRVAYRFGRGVSYGYGATQPGQQESKKALYVIEDEPLDTTGLPDSKLITRWQFVLENLVIVNISGDIVTVAPLYRRKVGDPIISEGEVYIEGKTYLWETESGDPEIDLMLNESSRITVVVQYDVSHWRDEDGRVEDLRVGMPVHLLVRYNRVPGGSYSIPHIMLSDWGQWGPSMGLRGYSLPGERTWIHRSAFDRETDENEGKQKSLFTWEVSIWGFLQEISGTTLTLGNGGYSTDFLVTEDTQRDWAVIDGGGYVREVYKDVDIDFRVGELIEVSAYLDENSVFRATWVMIHRMKEE